MTKPIICTDCGSIGHLVEHCPYRTVHTPEDWDKLAEGTPFEGMGEQLHEMTTKQQSLDEILNTLIASSCCANCGNRGSAFNDTDEPKLAIAAAIEEIIGEDVLMKDGRPVNYTVSRIRTEQRARAAKWLGEGGE